MRIAVFANGFDSGGSGIAHSLVAGARALARRGHALLLGIPRDEGFDSAEPSEVAEGVEIVGLASLPSARTSAAAWWSRRASRRSTAGPGCPTSFTRTGRSGPGWRRWRRRASSGSR